MKIREGFCWVVIAVCLLPMTVAAQGVRPDNAVTICKNQPVPSGWVVVWEGSIASCTGNFPNAWDIKQPGATETICKVSPIPSGYVIQGELSFASCWGSYPNARDIRKL